jgi:tetratricopeptide (TPR) repeat protein
MKDGFRPWLLFGLAQGLLVIGRNAQAVDLLRGLVRDHPAMRRAWSLLGFLHADGGRFDEAVTAFDRALSLEPEHLDSIFNVAFVLQRAGRDEAALARFQQVIDANKFMDRAWYGMGLSLAKLGRHDDAAERFREAARLQPFNPYAGYQLAAALHKLGRQEEVQAEYERVRGFDPKISAQMRRDFGATGP